MSDKVPCYEYEPIYCKTRSGAVWPMMLEKALAKRYWGYNKIQEYPIRSNQTSLTPSQIMMDLTGLPSCEYDLAQWDKLVERGGPEFEVMVLHEEFNVRKILSTWNPFTNYALTNEKK